MWVLWCIIYISNLKKKDPGISYCFPIPQSTYLRMDQWGLSKRQFEANANMIKNPYANAGNTGNVNSSPGLGKSPGKGHGNPLQYSCLKNPMARGAWWATVHGEPEEPGGLQSMGSQRNLAGYSPWGARGAWRATVHGEPEEPGRLHTVRGVTKVGQYWAHIHNSRLWPVPDLKISTRERDREMETQTWSIFFQLFKRVFINFNDIAQFCRQKAFGIVISTINFIFMSNYHSISSHHTGQKQCSCS